MPKTGDKYFSAASPNMDWEVFEVPGREHTFMLISRRERRYARIEEAPPKLITPLRFARNWDQIKDDPFYWVDDGKSTLISRDSLIATAMVAMVFVAAYLGPALAGGEAAGAGAGAAEGVGGGAGGAVIGEEIADQAEEQVTNAVGESAAGAASSLADSVKSVTSSIRDVVSELRETIGPVVSGLSDVVHDISSTVQTINDDLIKPITQPIKATMDAVEAIRGAFERAQQNGIRGILELPESVSRALGSVDATLQRSVQMLGMQNLSNMEVLAQRGLMGRDGRTAGDFNATMETVFARRTGAYTEPQKFFFGEQIALDGFKAWARQQQEELFKEQSLPAIFFSYVFQLVGVLEGLAAERQPFIELWREEVARAAAIAKLSPSQVIELLGRDLVDFNTALNEIRASGLSDERARALIATLRKMPDTSRILDWYSRAHIDASVATRMLKAENWDDEQIETLLVSAYRELAPSDVLDMMHRGMMDDGTAQILLQRQGFTVGDAQLMIRASSKQMGLQDLIQLYDRMSATAPGGGFALLSTVAPDGLHEQGRKLGIDSAAVDVLWANHWRLLTPELAVQAYFRSYITRDMLAQALSAASIPPELHENFIDLQRPQLSVRQLATLVAAGKINSSEAAEGLRKRGYSEIDLTHLLELERQAVSGSSSTEASAVEGLTKTTVLSLFDAGTLDTELARNMLRSLGMGDAAIDATLLLHQVKQAHDERMARVELVKAQAKAGSIDLTAAQAQLAAMDLSADEQARAFAQLVTVVSERTKIPSESKMLGMWKKGILDTPTTVQALGLLGYSETWAALLIELEARSGNRSDEEE